MLQTNIDLIQVKRIVIFVSGAGTNLKNIVTYFKGRGDVEINCLMSNKSDAPAVEWGRAQSLPVFIFTKTELNMESKVLDKLRSLDPDIIVLAGFSWLIPSDIIRAFTGKIINIHPAFLPKYGGKGMYGMHVHEAVLQNKETHSGITIHLVNEVYDEGRIIFEAKIPIEEHETPDSLAEKVHKLECKHYPRMIDEMLSKMEPAQ